MTDNTENIEANKKELVSVYTASKGKTLSFSVLKRFLNEEELGDLLLNYKNNRKMMGGAGRTREQSLTRELTDAEMGALTMYITDMSVSVKEIAQQFGIKESSIRSIIINAAVRYLYQNKEICGF